LDARERAARRRRGDTDALARLTGDTGRGMGRLFKAMAFGHPKLGPLPGFEPPAKKA